MPYTYHDWGLLPIKMTLETSRLEVSNPWGYPSSHPFSVRIFHEINHPAIGDLIFMEPPIYHWPYQEPKLEVPTIYKAYFSGLCTGIYPQNMAKHMVRLRTSILGSWNSHWILGIQSPVFGYQTQKQLLGVEISHYLPIHIPSFPINIY